MKKLIRTMAVMLVASALAAPAAVVPVKTLLLSAYFRVLLIQQVPGQAQSLCGQLPEQDAAQVQAALAAWAQQQTTAIRQELATRFGAQSREPFEQFAAEYSAAEGKKDVPYLRKLAAELGLEPSAGASYAKLRQAVAAQWLQADIQSASQFLSNLQTWLKLRATTPNLPPLQAWLDRDQKAPAPAVATEAAPPPSAAQLLAGAEAGVPEFKAPATEDSAPRNLYAEARKKRQDRRMEESQAAMQQVASERQVAEQEYAAKKQNEAQAEAEAIRGQAQKLAAVEQQSLEQQQNSWGNKLKAVVGTTISAAGGAFLGGIGTQAGQKAADALFNK